MAVPFSVGSSFAFHGTILRLEMRNSSLYVECPLKAIMRYSLRRRLNQTFIGLSLGPLLVVGVILTTLAYIVEEQQARVQESLVAQRVAHDVQSFLREVEGELQLTIQLGLFGLNHEQQTNMLLNLLSHHDDFEELILLDHTGQELTRVARLALVVPDETLSHAAADEFLAPFFTQNTYYSPITFAESTGEPILTMAVPIVNPRDGQVAGVLVAHTRLKQVWDIIALMTLRTGESVYIVNEAERVVAHRNPSVVLREATFALPPEDGMAVGLDSRWVILARQQLLLRGQNLIVVAERAAWNALALPILTGIITASLFLLTWVVATVLGVRAVGHVVSPLQDLAAAARSIRTGDLARRAMVVQEDEVGELAAAFNDMADQLRITLDGLQQKVAELEQLSRALQENEARYRSIFENAQEGIYRAVVQGRFVMVNPALVRMLGYDSDEELMNLDLAQDVYVVPTDRDVVLRQLEEQKKIANVEINWKKKDGRQITVSLYTHVIYDAHNQNIGYEGMVLDMTHRRQMEREREALIQELEAKNAELERFTYTVSHDLKAPLITIRGYLGFLEKDVQIGNDTQFKADMNRIVEATNRMQTLLAELLELSRIGRQINPPQMIPFATVVQEAITLTSGQLISHQVELVIAPDLPVVYGDEARLVEVMQNLLDNAGKYMGDQPQPCIEIGFTRQDGLGVFFVRDNGLGIDPRYHEKVFGLFEKLDPHSEGTGVGLALVKRIIEVHGGRIWIESVGLAQGATFYFTLPLVPVGDV